LGHTADSQVDYVRNQRLSISPSITWQPTLDTSVTLLTNYQHDPKAGLYNFVPSLGSVLPNPNGKIPTNFYAGDPDFNKIDRTQYSVASLAEHRFDNVWTGRQNIRYLHTDGNLNQVLPFGLEPDGRTLDRYVMLNHETIDAFNIDNQAQAKFSTGDVQHTLLFGLDYQRTWWDQRQGLDFGPSIDIFAPTYFQTIPTPAITTSTDQTQDQIGVYAQDQLKLDKWVFLLGGRQDWANTDTDDNLSQTSASQFDRAFTWRTGLVYLFDNGLAPYASYATSFQPTGGTDINGAAFEPRTGEQYEAGIKYQPRGYNSFITLSAFNLTQQNVLTPDPGNLNFNVQTGEIRTRGIELEGRASLAEGLNILGSYTYFDSTVTESNIPNATGKTPLYIPAHVASLWGDYTIPRGNLAGFGFGAGIRYIGKTYGNDDNTLSVPDYVLVDAALYYDLAYLSESMRGWKVAVNASNLFDKEYVSECTNDNCLYGMGRTVLATVRYGW
jgi:iron complex outermembrane receptor protein